MPNPTLQRSFRYVLLSRACRETESWFVLAVKRGKLNIKLKTGGNIMAAITFDTLKFVEKLKAAGVPESRAKAEAEALQEALGTAEVATKRDIERVEGQLREMKAEINGKLTLVQWMLALVVAAEVVPLLGKLF